MVATKCTVRNGHSKKGLALEHSKLIHSTCKTPPCSARKGGERNIQGGKRSVLPVFQVRATRPAQSGHLHKYMLVYTYRLVGPGGTWHAFAFIHLSC